MSSISYIEIALERDLFVACLDSRNNSSNQKLFRCTYEYVGIVGLTVKNVNLAFKSHLLIGTPTRNTHLILFHKF